MSDAAIELVRKKTLTPSTAASVASCGGRFAVERLLERLVPSPPDPLGAAELGTATHQIYEDLFARPKGKRGLVVGAQLLERLEIDHPELEAPSDPALLARWRSEVQTRMVGLWEIENPDEIDVVAKEMHLTVGLDGIPFNGFIDRVQRAGDGVEVVDYKAGRGSAKKENSRYGDPHGDQIRLYAMALTKERPDLAPVTGGQVLYVFHRKRRDVDMSTQAIDGTRARYEKAWKLLTTQTEAGAFGLKTSPLCGWCPAVLVCPAALAAGKVPKTEAAEGGHLLGIGASPTTTAVSIRSGADSEDDYDPSVDFGDVPEALEATPQTPEDVPQTSQEVPEMPEETTPAPAMSEPPPAHPSTRSTTTTTRSTAMASEQKPWEETNEDGSLNLNSYASTAAFGTVALAVETLHAAGQRMTPKTVDAFAETLALIVQHCQEALDVRPSMQDGSHTRLRGALRTSIETMPPPFGADVVAWGEWVTKTEKRILSIHKAAVRLWSTGGQDSTPWATLAVVGLAAA
ncbi:MAG: RecB family exonuclease [Deltaproteobacteria bacterium]